MDIEGWDERYRSARQAREDFEARPNPLVMETASELPVGHALDLACGTGRNAIWLGEQGWRVTAVDGSAVAIDALQSRAADRGLRVDTDVADLENPAYSIEPNQWDFIVISYYLQLDLIEKAKQGLKSGGVLLVIVHITEPGEEPTKHRLRPGELAKRFEGWRIRHSYEGSSRDAAHKRAVAEIVAQKG